jgi:hypothetical protein
VFVGATWVCAFAIELNPIWLVRNINKTPSGWLKALSLTDFPYSKDRYFDLAKNFFPEREGLAQ